MIIVTMTSWKKRINNVYKVIDSIYNNTIKPDCVYLNLSLIEFPNKEVDLPIDLLNLKLKYNNFIINWVSGNTKCFKKVFPILQYLSDDDIIIDADDDILFPTTLIESRLKDFKDNDCKYPISSNPNRTVNFPTMRTVSAVSLFQKKMLNHWEEFVTEDIIKTYNDDRTYLYLFWLNGYITKGCTKWTVKELLKEYDMNLDGGITETKTGLFGRSYDSYVNIIVNKITNSDIHKSFGFFKK